AWKQRQSFSAPGKEILSIEPYEQLALKKVNEFLKKTVGQEPESRRLEMLQEAKKALDAVLLFHESAVARGLRQGVGWGELRKLLVAKLQEIQLSQVQVLTDAKNWDAAFDLGIRLSEEYPAQKELQVNLVKLLAKAPREALKNKSYGATRQFLDVLEAQFPNSPELEA